MPLVTVWSKPKGLPMAMTFCPTWRSRDAPMTTGARPLDALVELEDGDVLGRVAADQRGLDLPLIGQADHELVALLDDVEVGDDVALVVPDEAGAAARRTGSSDE